MTPEQAKALREPMARAEGDAALAVAPLICAHGAQGAIGGLAVVLGAMLATAHARGLLDGTLAENQARLHTLMGLGLQEQAVRLGGRVGRG